MFVNFAKDQSDDHSDHSIRRKEAAVDIPLLSLPASQEKPKESFVWPKDFITLLRSELESVKFTNFTLPFLSLSCSLLIICSVSRTRPAGVCWCRHRETQCKSMQTDKESTRDVPWSLDRHANPRPEWNLNNCHNFFLVWTAQRVLAQFFYL